MTEADPALLWTLGVLAGGKSLRMGADKAVMLFDGERLIDRVARNAGTRRL